jgi:hypothetical protein
MENVKGKWKTYFQPSQFLALGLTKNDTTEPECQRLSKGVHLDKFPNSKAHLPC